MSLKDPVGVLVCLKSLGWLMDVTFLNHCFSLPFSCSVQSFSLHPLSSLPQFCLCSLSKILWFRVSPSVHILNRVKLLPLLPDFINITQCNCLLLHLWCKVVLTSHWLAFWLIIGHCQPLVTGQDNYMDLPSVSIRFTFMTLVAWLTYWSHPFYFNISFMLWASH